jgi:hypothetical protein
MGYEIMAYRRLAEVSKPNDAEEVAEGIWQTEERTFYEVDGHFYIRNNATIGREYDIGHSDGEDIFHALPPALSEILREILETGVTGGVKASQCGYLLKEFVEGADNMLEETVKRHLTKLSKIFIAVENDGIITVI